MKITLTLCLEWIFRFRCEAATEEEKKRAQNWRQNVKSVLHFIVVPLRDVWKKRHAGTSTMASIFWIKTKKEKCWEKKSGKKHGERHRKRKMSMLLFEGESITNEKTRFYSTERRRKTSRRNENKIRDGKRKIAREKKSHDAKRNMS